jgi:cysteine desulfurase/selenocysteine lyase
MATDRYASSPQLDPTRPPVPMTSNPSPAPARPEVASLRREFPVLNHDLRPGIPLVYLDSGATALKPQAVIDAVDAYNRDYPANVHRGLHLLSERATEAFESTRGVVAHFLGDCEPACVIFTRGTTESINLVAQSWGRTNLKPDDEILLTPLEHHSNLVPWQLVAQATGARLVFTDLTEDGQVPLEFFQQKLSDRTKMVAVTAMSNVLGTVLPIPEIARLAHAAGAKILVDGAQSVPHAPTHVIDSNVDFLAFSGHKVYGPTGVGVLYGKRELLEAMPPLFGGGSMVLRVEEQQSTWTEIPWKFEAGTPPIAEVIGLGAAIHFVLRAGYSRVIEHEHRLTQYAHQKLADVEGLTILGPPPDHKGAILGMVVDRVHPHDLSQFVDRYGVAIRAGHHCAMPLHKRLNQRATSRASLALYNTTNDIDRLADAITAARAYVINRPRKSRS